MRKITNRLTLGTFPSDWLLPESLGIMIDKLLTTFWYSNEKDQEKAIYLLLSGGIRSWRKFEEVLSRINKTGKKDNSKESMMHNLNRLNAFLDHGQQQQFDNWVKEIVKKDKINNGSPQYFTRAFTPYLNGIDSKRDIIRNNIRKWGLEQDFGITS